MSTDLKDSTQYEGTIEVFAHRVKYRWWGEELSDMEEQLTEEAEEHITECVAQGLTSGELNHEDDRGPAIRGYWEIERS